MTTSLCKVQQLQHAMWGLHLAYIHLPCCWNISWRCAFLPSCAVCCVTLCISTKLCCVLCNAMHFYQAVHCAVCCATLCISTKLCSVLCNAVHFYQAQKVVLCRSEVPAGGGGGGWRLEGGLKFSPRFPTKMHREVMEVEEMHSGRSRVHQAHLHFGDHHQGNPGMHHTLGPCLT